MVEQVDVSQIRKHAERQAKLSSRIQTMQLQKQANLEVEGPFKGLFRKSVGASSAPAGPREDQAYTYTEYLTGLHSLLAKGADSYLKAGGTLEEELNESRDIKESMSALGGGGTTNPIVGGGGAFLAICTRHAALQKMAVDPKGKAKAS